MAFDSRCRAGKERNARWWRRLPRRLPSSFGWVHFPCLFPQRHRFSLVGHRLADNSYLACTRHSVADICCVELVWVSIASSTVHMLPFLLVQKAQSIRLFCFHTVLHVLYSSFPIRSPILPSIRRSIVRFPVSTAARLFLP
jgi:hypothetical protein